MKGNKKIGLYFGSFNPIHVGHLIIANHILNEKLVDQVWFVVSPQNPFKEATGLLNEHHRLAMVQLAIGDSLKLKASDIEFKLPKPSYTIDTLAYLNEKYPEKTFCIVMGSDGFQNLHKWKNAEAILKHYDLLVYPRPEFPIENKYNARLTVVNAPLLEISSTFIRNLIKEKKSIRFVVTDEVKQEIERNGYYR